MEKHRNMTNLGTDNLFRLEPGTSFMIVLDVEHIEIVELEWKVLSKSKKETVSYIRILRMSITSDKGWRLSHFRNI